MRPGSKRASGAMNLGEFTEIVYPSGSSNYLVCSVLSAAFALSAAGSREIKQRSSLIFLTI
jgi:hypothetical protein